MSAYTITYLDEQNEKITSEAVFMRSLRAAKSSGTARAPYMTSSITIANVVGKLLATKEGGKWVDH